MAGVEYNFLFLQNPNYLITMQNVTQSILMSQAEAKVLGFIKIFYQNEHNHSF